MEKIPTPNAETRVKALASIMMQQMVLNKTLQLDVFELAELYEKLSELDSVTLIQRAASGAFVLENITPEHIAALNLRLQQVIFKSDPFTNENSPL